VVSPASAALEFSRGSKDMLCFGGVPRLRFRPERLADPQREPVVPREVVDLADTRKNSRFCGLKPPRDFTIR